MGYSRFSKEKLLPILINRSVIFFFVMCLVTLFVYFAGTFQQFIDSTQLALLRTYTVLGIFLVFTSAAGVLLDLVRLLKTKKLRYLSRAGGYLFLVIFSVITVLIVMAILTATGDAF